MRTIKFRGKRVDNGEWVYGSLNLTDGRAVIEYNISDNDGDIVPWFAVVDPDSVGQYIGRIDSKKAEIFEGDIFTVNGKYPKVVEYREDRAAFCIANVDELGKEWIDPWQQPAPDWWESFEREIVVIGNIHDKS